MKRREFVVAATGLLVVPLVLAQDVQGKRRVALLSGGGSKSHGGFVQAFRDGMKEYGWIEGRNLVLELRWAEGQWDRLPALAAELVRLKPEVIVSAASMVHLAVRKETSIIPIVMATGSDPVETGLVESLARPGGNITGLSGFYEATPFKIVELAGSVAPRGALVAALVDVNTPWSKAAFRAEIERGARALGIRLEFFEAGTPRDALRAIEALGKRRPAALAVLPSPMFLVMGDGVVKSAETLKVPVIYPFEELVEAGGFASYAPHVVDQYRRAAYYVDRILRGAKPGELPIEQATRILLTINLKSARRLGIKIPQSLLSRADRVIE